MEKEAKHCQFRCNHDECSAEAIAVRDQIVIGTHNNKIREEALKLSWDLPTLRREGMKMESALRGGAEISGEPINKLGKYSYSRMRKKDSGQRTTKKSINCYNCGNQVMGPIVKHKEVCPAKNAKCNKCGKVGHFGKVCKSPEGLRQVELKEAHEEEGVYNINLSRMKASVRSVKPKMSSGVQNKNDFKAQLVVNNCLDSVIIDTGAQISVCGTVQARRWNMLENMIPSKVRIKPYKSTPIPVHGQARCAVTFGQTSFPVVWHIMSGSCEQILAGKVALQLGIIDFNSKPEAFQPVLMIESESKGNLQEILMKYPQNFNGVGKLHVNKDIKPAIRSSKIISISSSRKGSKSN